MRITVTEEHIRNGVPKDPCECPIALAIRTTARKFASVGASHIIVGDTHYDTPMEAWRFLAAFDQGREVKPFSFEIPVDG